MPTVSFVIPTLGERDTLQRTLDSIEQQAGDEVLVINLHLPKMGWGGRERNVGIAQARCDFITFIDDDDYYLPGARQAMEEAALAHPALPTLFKMRYPSGREIWDKPKLRCGNVGTPMIFVPNIKKMLPVWGDRSHSDFQFVNCFGWDARKIVWNPTVTVQVGHEDLRWWSYQNVDKSVYSMYE